MEKDKTTNGGTMTNDERETRDQAAAERARSIVNDAAKAATTEGDHDEDIEENEVAGAIEDLETEAAGNVSRGCPAADEYGFVEAVREHLKAWGY